MAEGDTKRLAPEKPTQHHFIPRRGDPPKAWSPRALMGQRDAQEAPDVVQLTTCVRPLHSMFLIQKEHTASGSAIPRTSSRVELMTCPRHSSEFSQFTKQDLRSSLHLFDLGSTPIRTFTLTSFPHVNST